MIEYELNSGFPRWHFDEATNRQLKVLKFFEVNVLGLATKGRCSGLIARLFADPVKKGLWAAYVYVTGDEGDGSADLLPHNMRELELVRVPVEWRPRQYVGTSGTAQDGLESLAIEVLRDGSPFDDPAPDLFIHDCVFCFTGAFKFGTRTECRAAVVKNGGRFTERVTKETDVLVIGGEANRNWSHGSFGSKIIKAMMLRLKTGRPWIVPELLWERAVVHNR